MFIKNNNNSTSEVVQQIEHIDFLCKQEGH